MNLIEDSFQTKKEEKNRKVLKIVILVSIVLVVFIIIGILGYLSYLKNSELKVYLDEQLNPKLKELLVIEEDGTVSFPVKEVAPFFGYDSYNGEYTNKSENKSKCYVQSKTEVVNVSLGSNKIYKLELTQNSSNYKYIYLKEAIKSNQGTLYAKEEAASKIFNLSFEYNKEKNIIEIYTTPYLVTAYNSVVLDYGYSKISQNYNNQKAILNGILVVESSNSKVGVIDIEGNIILEAKYDDITYLPDTGDFLVKSNNKYGIMSKSREMKVQIMYDSIELMDSDANLYLVKKDNKYGIIDFQGNIKVYTEYDEIGIDISKFQENNIKNNYLLVNNLIPIKKDGLWGLFNKNGKQLVEFKYDSFGYIASSNKNAINLLVIPDYDVLVASIDNKYTLINSSGQELFPTVADDIYMTVEAGETHYYIAVNNGQMDAIEYLERRGIKTTNNNEQDTTNSDNSKELLKGTDNEQNNESEEALNKDRNSEEQQNNNETNNEDQNNENQEKDSETDNSRQNLDEQQDNSDNEQNDNTEEQTSEEEQE